MQLCKKNGKSTSGDLGGDDHPAERGRTAQPKNESRTILARQVCFVLHFFPNCRLSNCLSFQLLFVWSPTEHVTNSPTLKVMSLSFYNNIKWSFFSSTNFLEWRAQFCLCSQDDSEMAQTVTFLGGLKVKILNIVDVLSVLKNCPSILRIKLICMSNVFFSQQVFFCWGKKSFSIKVDHVSTSTNASYVLRLHFFLQNTLFTILLNSYSAVLDVLLCFPF